MQVVGLDASENKTLFDPIFQEKESKNSQNAVVHESSTKLLEEEPFDNKSVTKVKTEEDYLPLNTNHEFKLQIEQTIQRKEGLWICKVCGKTTAKKLILQKHAEIHIEGFSHVCNPCSKTFSTNHSLRTHMSDHHSEVIFSCDICEKSGMNRMAYKNHKRRNHNTVSVKQ